MDWLFAPLGITELEAWETFINDWVFVLAFGFLLLELVRYAVMKRLSWRLVGDSVTNYITLALSIGIGIVVLGGLYLTVYSGAAQYALFDIPVNWASVLICIVLADLAYYWEHRFTHRVNIAWATHSVHHSSPYYNLSVANRFGPMDTLWPIFFYLPLVLLGFNPFVVLFAEVMVLAYQTYLHTEAIRKLPSPIEWLFNTPSHHRVHHGANEAYLDSNYGGMFIIWDRMFGTFVPEDEPVDYGLVKPIDSINPITVFLHGFARLAKKLGSARSPGEAWMALAGTPDWEPRPRHRERAPAE